MFIKQFEYRGKHYVYGVNSNMLTMVSKELYTILEKDADLSKNMEFASLFEKGYFHNYNLKVINNPLCDKIQYLNDRQLSFFIFQVTQGCNLRCSYCPYSQTSEKIRHHKSANMTWEIAKKGLDFYFNHSVDSNFIGIGFYGGEPLIKLYMLIKQKFNLSFVEDDFKEYSFICIDSIVQTIKRKLDENE